MTVFSKSTKPNPYVTLFPKLNCGSIVRLDNFKISCIQDVRDMALHIEYTPARLYKNKCMDCNYLEIAPDLNQTGSIEDRTCKGFFKLNHSNRDECVKQYKDTDLEIVNITVPNLMWSLDSNNKFRLFAVKTVGGVLYKTAYTLANVYNNGDICWGRANKNPTDLRDASIKYWSLPFNYDLMTDHRDKGDLRTKLSTFKLPDDNATVLERWSDCSDVFGNASLFRNKQADGASIWFNDEILTLLPLNKIYSVRRLMTDGQVLDKCAVAWIKYLPQSNSYLLDFDGFKIVKEKLTIKSKTTVLGNIQD